MSASSTVPAGTPVHASGGETFSPSQVKRVGMVAPCWKAELDSTSARAASLPTGGPITAPDVVDVVDVGWGGAVTPGSGGRSVRPSPVSHPAAHSDDGERDERRGTEG